MKKPQNYDNTQTFGGYTPLEVGGHLCVIKKVEEATSNKTGNPMIRIYLDTTNEDKQPHYYTDKWNSDNRENKKWGCIVYQMVLDKDGNCSKGFKTFVEAVKESNNGFNENCLWGNEPIDKFLKGKLVGGVFGREQFDFLDNYGQEKTGFAVKCQGFRTIKDVKEGKVEAPKDKLLATNNNNVDPIGFNNNSPFSGGSFENDITPVDDGDMPF